VSDVVVHVNVTSSEPARPVIVERRGVVVHVNGEPTWWLEQPISWRPQDVPESWRAVLWPERA
jgi:hypothetical protein